MTHLAHPSYTPAPGGPNQTTSAVRPASVLIVDDLADNRALLSRWLALHGYTTTAVGSGTAALEIMQAQSFDLVMLDMMMPAMSGLDVLLHLKRNERLQHVPVIVVSALNDVERIARCIEIGAEDFLVRPYNPVLLRARVEASLQKRRAVEREHEALRTIEAASRSKSEFLSHVVHELKTPITIVRAYADWMRITGAHLDEQHVAALAAIRSATELMVSLLSDLSDLNRIEAGHLRLSLQPTALPLVVNTVATAFHHTLGARSQSLRVAVPADLPLVYADPLRVTQMLNNLLSNAAKFTPEGGRIALEASVDNAGAAVQVTVRDSGIGIAPADQQRLFQQFFRANDARVMAIPGTGLGLNITHHLVTLHGGLLWFESEPEVGSSFHFTLPLAPHAEPGA
jgi:signal transduction histidine kinase